ncbi:MAG: cytochrome c3 family protein [Nitrospiraceae bacterium]|nr:cytochrome c3 family protein [Nitrospiraceae bacterium]
MSNKKFSRVFILFVAVMMFVAFGIITSANSANAPVKKAPITKSLGASKVLSKESKACMGCHKPLHPGIVKPWEDSSHAKTNVGCFECHQAKKTSKTAMEHYGQTITVIVSPNDCAKCHPQEVKEQTTSHHAKANQFTGSLDNVLGRLVTGEANFDLGCTQCHGSEVVVEKGGKLQVGPWPNTGVGRINPDGSNGSCTACHQRHFFNVKQAREPKTCGKCHQGPDHPQIEIYELSKHGIAYAAFQDKLNMDKNEAKGPWVLGKDYIYAPVCSTCHMGATTKLSRTHDVGARIKWTLRPPISKILPDGEKKREEMKKVCSECHTSNWYNGFFTQFDRFVELYNEKFAIPSTNIMKFLYENKVIDPTPFNDIVEIHYWHLWHHEGRRGRHGAAMHAPDWSHWHGLYEVAINFYFMLLPEANNAVAAKNDSALTAKWEAFRDKIMNSQDHIWKKGMPKEELRKIVDFYKKRYGKEGGQ